MASELSAAFKVLTAFRKMLDDGDKKKQREWVEKCLTESTQVGSTVAIALLAAALGRAPFDDEVQQFIADALADGTFLPRCHRLLTELLSSPSKRRRRRLAATLFGGPQVATSADDRDRLDILVERLLDEDIETLRLLCSIDPVTAKRVALGYFDLTVCLWPAHGGFRIVLGADLGDLLTTVEIDRDASRPEPKGPVIPSIALTSLTAAGCIEVTGPRSLNESWVYADRKYPTAFVVTDLGRFLVASLTKLAQATQSTDGL